VRIEDVSLNEDHTVVTLSFTGAPEYEPTNPCAMEYSATAAIKGDVLEGAVAERMSPFALPLPPMGACPAVGFGRRLDVNLGRPFDGSTVRDRSGNTFFVSAPTGLAELAGLPGGWALLLGEDLTESETGRWLRAWSSEGRLPQRSGQPGRLDLIQAFGRHAGVSGANAQPPVMMQNGVFAQLWTWPATGELVLSWTLRGDGLALVANEADFTVDELVALAESAVLPD